MAAPRKTPTLHRLAFLALVLVALTLVSIVASVLLTGEPPISEDDRFPEVVAPNFEKRPGFRFPESLRTTDLSLNRFIDRFARVCLEGRYSEFRLMQTRRTDPLPPERFESMFNALKDIHVLRLEPGPPIAGMSDRVWILDATYELEDFADPRKERKRNVTLAIAKEDGEWRLGPISDRARRGETPASGPAPSEQDRAHEADAPPTGADAPMRAAGPSSGVSSNRRASIRPSSDSDR